MSISDEALMAYADGEADAATRASVESAMREDPQIAQRVARHRAMRQAMAGAFADVLREPVPDRLVAAARGRSAGTSSTNSAGSAPAYRADADDTVVEFAGVLAAAAALKKARSARRWQPIALAASVLLGVGTGFLIWHNTGNLIEADSRGLVAGAALSNALSSQLSEDRGANLTAITGLSFRDKSGDYCRTFSLRGTGAASGLACRDGSQWRIKALAQPPETQGDGNFRTAASSLPPIIRAAVEETIEGEPLDRPAEVAARQSGWSAPGR